MQPCRPWQQPSWLHARLQTPPQRHQAGRAQTPGCSRLKRQRRARSSSQAPPPGIQMIPPRYEGALELQSCTLHTLDCTFRHSPGIRLRSAEALHIRLVTAALPVSAGSAATYLWPASHPSCPNNATLTCLMQAPPWVRAQMAKDMAAGRWRGQAKPEAADGAAKAGKEVPKPYMSTELREDSMRTTGRAPAAFAAMWFSGPVRKDATRLRGCAGCMHTVIPWTAGMTLLAISWTVWPACLQMHSKPACCLIVSGPTQVMLVQAPPRAPSHPAQCPW